MISSTWMTNWLTPLWLVCLGAGLGLVAAALIWVVFLVLGQIGIFRNSLGRTAREIRIVLTEGVLFYVLGGAGLLAICGLLGFFVARKPVDILRSVPHLLTAGTTTRTFEIAPTPKDTAGVADEAQEELLAFRLSRAELTSMRLLADNDLIVSSQPYDPVLGRRPELEVVAEETREWTPADRNVQLFSPDQPVIDTLYVVNKGNTAANLQISVQLQPEFPEVAIIPIIGGGIGIMVLFYFLIYAFAPKVSAIALATFKSNVAQNLFLILILLGLISLWAFNWIPYNTFGEDIKVLKDTGLTLVMVLGIIQAVWAAGTSVSDEIEGKSALTVLSKPVGRRSYVLGKFLGIGWTVGLLFLFLGFVLLTVVAYKPLYDSRELSMDLPSWNQCFVEMVSVIPGLCLGFMEALVLAGLSVAISTRLPLLPNIMICFAIYVLGHISSLLVESSGEQLQFVRFFAQLIPTIFPNLENFSVQAAVAGNRDIPLEYLGWSLIYCLLFSVIAMLLALLFFEDRDVA